MVGWFVVFAILLLVAGFVFYLYSAAEKRGWFVINLNYATGVNDATGLTVGEPVRLMGFDAGSITKIVPNQPTDSRGVTVFFNIRQSREGYDYFGYIWWDSKVRVNSDLLGKRFLEVEKGTSGPPSVYRDKEGDLMVMKRSYVWSQMKALAKELRQEPQYKDLPADVVTNIATADLLAMVESNRQAYYTNASEAGFTRPANPAITNYYYIPSVETPPLSDRLEAVALTVQKSLPNVFQLTNEIAGVLSNANRAVAQLNATLEQTHPTLTNLDAITSNLRNPNGSLGEWVLGTNLTAHLDDTVRSARETLAAAHSTLDLTDTNMTMLATNLDQTLSHLADLTSNLAWQVQVNTNLVSSISKTIIDTDNLVQGLKREWFLRGAFKKKHKDP